MKELFVDKFFKMEEEFGLFDLEEMNFPLWDIIRYDIYYKYYWPENKVIQHLAPPKNAISYLKIFYDFVYTTLYFCLNWSGNLILPCSRYKNSENKFFDKAAMNIINSLDSKFILEMQSIYARYEYKSATSYLALFKSFNKQNIFVSDANYNKIKDALVETFENLRIDKAFIDRILRDFVLDYKFYCLIFAIKPNFKRVYFVQNGLQKGLIAAAKQSKISVIELQHGSFERDHLGYSYPNFINHKSDILMPDTFCKLGDYWGKGVNMPIKNVITTGNDFFVLRDIEVKSDFILIISSRIHQLELLPLTKDLSLKYPLKKIIFKLHSNEFSTKNDCIAFFYGCNNVDVISNEYKIDDLIAQCEFVVAINSTVVYEALTLNKKVYIYRKVNYESLMSLDNNHNICFIDNADQIVDNILYTVNSYDFEFFAKFQKSKLVNL